MREGNRNMELEMGDEDGRYIKLILQNILIVNKFFILIFVILQKVLDGFSI